VLIRRAAPQWREGHSLRSVHTCCVHALQLPTLAKPESGAPAVSCVATAVYVARAPLPSICMPRRALLPIACTNKHKVCRTNGTGCTRAGRSREASLLQTVRCEAACQCWDKTWYVRPLS
jgi:hypothetical protein